tara:strand:+ start:834 stop:1205 length:372 start_codon:yes stop_codon:yes gene_type:complete
MKKNILSILVAISLISIILPKDVSPVLSIRHDDLSGGLTVSDAIGLKMDLGNSRFTGFDTDGTDYRIYVGWGFGKIGFGDDGSGTGEYTVGATYQILNNILMDLDYVYNENNQNLRLGIEIHF